MNDNLKEEKQIVDKGISSLQSLIDKCVDDKSLNTDSFFQDLKLKIEEVSQEDENED